MRKRGHATRAAEGAAPLQWGRNFIVAETRSRGCAEARPHSASMGPQLYRCGNKVGAAVPVDHGLASMGPQLYRCGNGLETPHTLNALQELQWGRNFIVAETCRRRAPSPGWWRASMGPQLYRCGNRACCVSFLFYGLGASMGPQLYRCGNQSLVHDIQPVYQPLQWGRNFIVAETRTDPHSIR